MTVVILFHRVVVMVNLVFSKYFHIKISDNANSTEQERPAADGVTSESYNLIH